MERLPKTILAVVFFSLAGVLTYFAISSNSETVALSVVGGADIDLAQVSEGTMDGTYFLKNNTDKPIEILAIRKSCSCSRVGVEKIVPPGRSIPVSYTWTVTGMYGEVYADTLFRYAVEHSNDRLDLKVRLRAVVDPDFVINCDAIELYWGTQRDSFEVVLTPHRLKECRILSAKCDNPGFACTEFGDHRIGVKMISQSPTSIDDQIAAFVILETNSINRPRLSIPIFVRQSDATSIWRVP